jgi:hypothetical protein
MATKLTFIENTDIKIQSVADGVPHNKMQVAMSNVTNNTVTNVMQFVNCKDFLNEFLCAELNKSKYSQYGFTWKHTGYFDDKKKYFYVTLKYDNKYYSPTTILKIKKFMREYSKIFKIPTVKIDVISNNMYLASIPMVITTDKMLFTLTLTMFRLCLLYDSTSYVQFISDLPNNISKYPAQHSDLLAFKNNNKESLNKVIKLLLTGGRSYDPKTVTNTSKMHNEGWKTLVLSNNIQLYETQSTVEV